VSDPRIERPLIQRPRLRRSLMPGSVVGEGVILLGAIGRSVHEDDAVVSLVPESGPRPPLLVEHGLVGLLGHVGGAVGDSAVAEDEAGTLAHLGHAGDIVLEVDLELDDVRLELDDVARVVLPEVTQPSRHSHDGRHLRHRQHPETTLGEVLLDRLEGSALARTGTTR
jgi:hypothetical protein